MSKFQRYAGPWIYTLTGDDEHLYRAMLPTQMYILDVAKDCPFFVPHERTDMTLTVTRHKNCPVIKIRRLPFQLRCQELTRARALEMVRMLIDLAIFCIEKHRCIPFDIHEANLMYWDQPWFTDYDAVRALDAPTAAACFVRIGYLFYKFVRKRHDIPYEQFDFYALARTAPDSWMAKQFHRDYSDYTKLPIWHQCRKVFAAVRLKPSPKTHWSHEYEIGKLDDISTNPKFARLLELAPSGRTLLDVGCNRGYVGHLLRDRFENILGFDKDEAVIDATTPTPGVNFGCFGIEHLENGYTLPNADRFHADVVICLALTHHLQTAGFAVPRVAKILSSLTKKHLLIEDIVAVEQYHRQFKKHGLVVEKRLPSHPSGRMLTLWRRK